MKHQSLEVLPNVLRKTRERLQSLKSLDGVEELAGGGFDVDDAVTSDLEDLENMTRNEITGKLS